MKNDFNALICICWIGEGQATIKQSTSSIIDGIDLEDIREFARNFKMRRLVLGLTQTQVGQALSATEGPAYSQSAICRLKKNYYFFRCNLY